MVRVNVVLNRTVVVDSNQDFDNLCSSNLQSQNELFPTGSVIECFVIPSQPKDKKRCLNKIT